MVPLFGGPSLSVASPNGNTAEAREAMEALSRFLSELSLLSVPAAVLHPTRAPRSAAHSGFPFSFFFFTSLAADSLLHLHRACRRRVRSVYLGVSEPNPFIFMNVVPIHGLLFAVE